MLALEGLLLLLLPPLSAAAAAQGRRSSVGRLAPPAQTDDSTDLVAGAAGTPPQGGAACASIDECFLGGECRSGTCVCDAWRTAANCSQLNLLPARPKWSGERNATKHILTPSTASHPLRKLAFYACSLAPL